LTTPASETIQNSLSAFPSISSSLAENLFDQGSNLADKVSSDFNSLSNSNFALATGKFSTIRDINTQLQFGDGLSSTNIENLTAQKASIITSLNENLGSAFSNARMTNFEDYLSTTGDTASIGLSFAANAVDVVNNPSPRTAVNALGGFSAGLFSAGATYESLMAAAGLTLTAPLDLPVIGVGLLTAGVVTGVSYVGEKLTDYAYTGVEDLENLTEEGIQWTRSYTR